MKIASIIIQESKTYCSWHQEDPDWWHQTRHQKISATNAYS